MKLRMQIILDELLAYDGKIKAKVMESSCGKYKHFVIVLYEVKTNRHAELNISRATVLCNWFVLKSYLTFIVTEAIEVYFREAEESTDKEIIRRLLQGYKYIADMDGSAGESYVDEWTEAGSFMMCQDLANAMLDTYSYIDITRKEENK